MKYHARLTERWGQSSYRSHEEGRIAFPSIKAAADFMSTALHSQMVYVANVKYCDDGCGHFHVCPETSLYVDIEQETAHLDLYIAGSDYPEMRLVYGPRGGIVRESY